MQITKVVYSRGTTLNIGNFESVRVDITAEGVVENGESFEAVYAGLKEEVDAAVRAETQTVRKRAERAERS